MAILTEDNSAPGLDVTRGELEVLPNENPKTFPDDEVDISVIILLSAGQSRIK